MKNIILTLIIGLILSSSLLAQGEFYDVIPDINSCNEGKLKEAEKQKILSKVNSIRSIHGLKPVTYNYSKDDNMQKSALITASNEMLSHQPPTNWKCYSPVGAEGSKRANLHIRWFYGSTYPKSEESIISWMIDMNVDVCGHRRWILDPFLKFIAFGRVDGPSTNNPQFKVTGASIYVIDDDKQQLGDWDDDFIAYPYHNYPSELVFDNSNNYWHFHFTAVFNKSNWWANNEVSYASAVLEIKDDDGNPVPFSDVTSNNSGYGVPNMLRFRLTSLERDKRYNVTIKNVSFKGQNKDFSYWFKVTDNVGTVPVMPVLNLPANGATDQTTDLTLSWNPAAGASTYNLQVAKDDSFNQFFLTENNIAETSFNVTGLEQSTTYYWRVSATNDIGASEWSTAFNFTTGTSGGGNKPILVYPADNETSVPPTAKIQWESVPDAETYHLQISDINTFPLVGLPVDQQNIPTNYYTIPNRALKEDTRYWYRVRAMESDVFGEWSDVYSFHTWILSSVEDNFGEDANFIINPNPADNKITINTNVKDGFTIKLYDNSGSLMSIYPNIYPGQEIDISELSSGTYIIVVFYNEQQFSKRLQVVR